MAQGGSLCSTMSSEKRCFSFMLAALRIVRIDRAVRPCFPITLPTSLWETRNRMMVDSPSAIASTETLPGHRQEHELSHGRGLSYSLQDSPLEETELPESLHTFGSGSHEETLKPVPSSRLQRDLPGSAETSETPVADSPAITPSLLLCKRQTTNYAIPRSLRETVCRTYCQDSSETAIFGNHNRIPKVSGNQVTLCRSDCFCRLRGHQFSDALRQLRSIAGPVVDAVALQINSRGGRARIVGAHHFNGTAVTGAVLFNNNDAVVGLLTRSNARQTDHQHGQCLSEHFLSLSYRVACQPSIWIRG